MKKILAILLTFILTFSCYSVLGGTVTAEEATAEDDKILIASDYNTDSQRWSTYKTVNKVDENSDGVTDYIQLDGAKSAYYSYAANLTPGVQYEFSFYARVPEDSADYTTSLYPTYGIYLPQVVDTTTMKSTSRFTVSATATSNNFYAYKNMRHNDFSAVWTVGNQEPVTRTRYSNFDPTDKTQTPNEIYSDWTKVTAVFTACEPTEGDILPTDAVDNRVALSIGLRTDDYAGMKLDVKDIVLKEYEEATEEPEEPTPEEPVVLRGPEVFEGFEDFEAGTNLYDYSLTGTQNMYTYSSKAALLTSFGSLTVTDEYGYNGSKQSLMGKTYYQYAAMPLNLTPNTKYELSFWYAYTTTNADRYLNKITYGVYVPDPDGKTMATAPGAGTRTMTEVFAPNDLDPGIWRKATVDFTTGDNVEGMVFAYTYHDKLKSDISQTVNKCPLYIDNVSIIPVESENAPQKANLSIQHKDAVSVDIISGYFKDFAVGEEVQFKVRTKDSLVPTVTVNDTELTANSNGLYSFIATEDNIIKVECEGDETRFDPNNYNGLPLYEYNKKVASTPIWEGNVVYHETVLFIPERETAKLIYPIDKVISVRSYGLEKTYLEGVDYEVTEDGQLKILEGSSIPVWTVSMDTNEDSSFPIVGKEDTYAKFMDDYTYPAYAINITYEHSKVWESEPETIETVVDQLPNVIEKLENGEDVNVIIFGDSASCGWSTSGNFYDNLIYNKQGVKVSNVMNIAPYTPAWPVMVEQNLKILYPNAKINFKHIALGGTTAEWGKGVIQTRLGYLEADYGLKAEDIDLMILGYGGNDLTAGHTAEEYYNNMQEIINNFRSATGETTEVLLWTEYRPRPDIEQFSEENLAAYRQKNFDLAEANDGVAVVDFNRVYNQVMESKQYYDVFNDAVIHGNDFLTRIIAQCVISALTKPEYLAGDINSDEITNLKDLVTIAQYVAKWENLTVNQSIVDVNEDGIVDLNDVTTLAQYLAGWEVKVNGKFFTE